MQQLSVESFMVHHYPMIEQFPHTAKKLLFSGMKRLCHENQINEFLVANRHKDALSFIEAIIDYFDITIGLKKDEMAR
ncbi:MAG: GNAT family N-acetyltransferase, partial [Sulfurovum sp.]|nr:GNAT family N-acetyltransferase [Sulfurovum sp.]